MSERYDKLKALLRELFQMDRPELDFGLYRIMHAKSAEVSRFLDDELLPQVRQAFKQYRSADRAELERELEEAIEKAEELGADPETTPKVQQLRVRLEERAVDLGALEAEVYDHLYRFFRRYYSDGDFLSKRVYKPGVYAIPYEGEEVKLHWANADQYYTKTSEYLRDYAFRLRPGVEGDPMRVHFRLVDAAEGEHGNVKEGRDRVFVLAPAGESGRDFLSETEGEAGRELVVRFEYRPATMLDWPEDKREEERERLKHPKPPKQEDLNALAARRILAVSEPALARWIEELGKPHVRSDGEEADHSRLEAHLRRYTARNTFDYFIHKDLGGFLRRELDFYIKNEVMHLDDIESESAPRVEQYLSKIKVIRRIAGKIIDFLAQLEDFQKKFWLKKKFVVETSWCVRVGCITEELYPQIAANADQRQEWVELHGIDELQGDQGDLTRPRYSEPLTPKFLGANPTLMVDTRHFDEEFGARLLEAIEDLDGWTDGVLIHGENFQALSLMERRYRHVVDCVYIDPPYNSTTTEIAYKNTYKDSSWLSLMENRLSLSKALASDRGSHIVAIDENEQELLGRLLSVIFPAHGKICISVVHNKKGIQGRYFSYNHEYAYFCLPPGLDEVHGTPLPEEDWDYANLRKWGRESERETAKNAFYPILVRKGEIIGFGEVCDEDFHPGEANIEKDDYVEVYPVDSGGTERKWRYARDSVESILPLLKVHTVSATGEVQIHKAKAERMPKTVWDDSRYIAGDYGTRWLTDLAVKVEENLYPKSMHTVGDSIFAVSGANALTLDYFAGSGTTGHAVISLNREDGGSRKFILVEMGEYFDTVLLPRLKKVTFTPEWKDGKPEPLATPEEAERSPRVFKVLRLESYEDTLNNLEVRRTEVQQELLDDPNVRGPEGFREDYLLRYMLEVETRGSPSLLNIQVFDDPTDYILRVKRPGSDETRATPVDLVETFNWLIGLRVEHLGAPRSYRAGFRRDEEDRLRLDGDLEEVDQGPYWFRAVRGTAPDGRKVLLVWRKRTGDPEKDNLVLDEWFSAHYRGDGDVEFDLVYTNGGSNLENLKGPEELWTVRLIEDDFLRLMFAAEEG